MHQVCTHGHHIEQSEHQRCYGCNPARGQLDRENAFFPVRLCLGIWYRETASVVPSRVTFVYVNVVSRDSFGRNVPRHVILHCCCCSAPSLRNLVSGYECGKVFPASVGPGSPSRDTANWLPSPLSRSAETWRRYGWLRMVFPGVRLFRAPIWCTSEVAARER